MRPGTNGVRSSLVVVLAVVALDCNRRSDVTAGEPGSRDAGVPEPRASQSEGAEKGVAGSTEGVKWGDVVDGLQLGLQLNITESHKQPGGELHLRNASSEPITVCATSNTVLVGCEVRAEANSGLVDSADLSQAGGGSAWRHTFTTIAPGDSFHLVIDGAPAGEHSFRFWDLAPGKRRIVGTYDTAARLVARRIRDKPDVWRGRLRSGGVQVTIAGKAAPAGQHLAWGQPENGLQARLEFLSADTEKMRLRFSVRNAGAHAHRIMKLPAARSHWCPLPIEVGVSDRLLQYQGVQAAPPPLRAQDFIYLDPGVSSSVEAHVLLADWGIRVPAKISLVFVLRWQAREVTAFVPGGSKKVQGLWTGQVRSPTIKTEIAPQE